MKNEKNRENDAISEKDIQKRLYGMEKPKKSEVVNEESKFSEKDIQKKLYSVEKRPPQKPEVKEVKEIKEIKEIKKEPDLFIAKKEPAAKIAAEIDTLKQAVSQLEEKLKKAETEKERLKQHLVQKQKLINIRESVVDLIINRMPEKFIIMATVVIVMVVLIVVINLKPKSPGKDDTLPLHEKEERVLPAKEEIPVSDNADSQGTYSLPLARRYTIQVAEYADDASAQRFIKSLKEQGFDVYIDTIHRRNNPDKPYYKISVGAFDTFEQAKRFNEGFRKKTNINDAFVREMKP